MPATKDMIALFWSCAVRFFTTNAFFNLKAHDLVRWGISPSFGVRRRYKDVVEIPLEHV